MKTFFLYSLFFLFIKEVFNHQFNTLFTIIDYIDKCDSYYDDSNVCGSDSSSSDCVSDSSSDNSYSSSSNSNEGNITEKSINLVNKSLTRDELRWKLKLSNLFKP